MNKIFINRLLKHSCLLNSIAVLTVSSIIACNGKSGQKASNDKNTHEINVEKPKIKREVLSGDTTRITIKSDDQMKFDQSELRAQSNTVVELTLIHTGQFPKEAMGHNVVILKQGIDVFDYAASAISASDNEYIANPDQTVAYTRLIGGGESTTINFMAPDIGIYDFICSFPGHYGVMQGKFIVE